MAQKHSTPIRGLMTTQRSPLFQRRFGRLFRSLPPATFGRTGKENGDNIAELGAAMSASFDPPKLFGDNHSVLGPDGETDQKGERKTASASGLQAEGSVNYALGKGSIRTRVDARR